jgi:hypothetical protein
MPAERPGVWHSVLRALSRALDARRRLAGLDAGAQRLAAERSRELLLACLTPAQRLEFDRTHAFTVRAESGRRYRIGFGTVANVEVLGSRGEVLYRLCAKPADLSTPAVMLAQKLMLETREAEFLRVAARHPVLPPLGAGAAAANPL